MLDAFTAKFAACTELLAWRSCCCCCLHLLEDGGRGRPSTPCTLPSQSTFTQSHAWLAYTGRTTRTIGAWRAAADFAEFAVPMSSALALRSTSLLLRAGGAAARAALPARAPPALAEPVL